MDTSLNLSIIAAVAENGVIGDGGELPPWKLKADMQRFVQLTKEHMVIAGRKTHDSILRKLNHPLKDRTTIVVSQQSNYQPGEECVVVNSWEEALQQAQGQGEVFVIGGAEIYKLALPYANTIYLTIVHGHFEGDAFFPQRDVKEWEVVGSTEYQADESNSHGYAFITLKRKHNPFVNLSNARLGGQREIMEEILTLGLCPFCPASLSKFHLKPILKETTHWLLTENQWPYGNTRVHLLAIHKTHIERLSDLTPEAAQEFFSLMQWAEKKFNLTGGGIGMRFGDITVNGATVAHLHAQLLTAKITDRNDPDYKPVRLRVG